MDDSLEKFCIKVQFETGDGLHWHWFTGEVKQVVNKSARRVKISWDSVAEGDKDITTQPLPVGN